MTEEETVTTFDLVVKNHLLPEKIEDLNTMRFIGEAAKKYYQAKIKLMNQLGMTQEQRDKTLKDGQDAGDMLLDIEARIGELSEREPKAKSIGLPGGGSLPSGKVPKYERLGLTEKQMANSQAIHQNPKAVEDIKREARENDDIPTKTAVLQKIKLEKYKANNANVPKEIPDINKVALDIQGKLSDCQYKLAEIYKHKDSISPSFIRAIEDSINAMVEIITEEQE